MYYLIETAIPQVQKICGVPVVFNDLPRLPVVVYHTHLPRR